MKYNFEKLTTELEKLSVTLSEQQLEQFEIYYDMLIEKNKVMNLTAITEFEEVLEKHFLDSVSLIRAVDLQQPLKVMDFKNQNMNKGQNKNTNQNQNENKQEQCKH